VFCGDVTSPEAIDGMFGAGLPHGIEVDAIDILEDIDTDWRYSKAEDRVGLLEVLWFYVFKRSTIVR